MNRHVMDDHNLSVLCASQSPDHQLPFLAAQVEIVASLPITVPPWNRNALQ